ncbi:hypothetical protein [Pseudoduganella sp. HUAS MS19]
MTTYVHIERIVLEGLDPGPSQLPRLQAAIEQELARLLAQGDGQAPLKSGSSRAVAGGVLELAGSPATPELGRRIAHATYEGIQRSARPDPQRGVS